MGVEPITGLALLAAFIIVSMLAVRALNRAVYPYREQMFEMAVEIINDPKAKPHEKSYAAYCMDHAMEFSGGWTILQAMGRAIVRAVESGAEPPRCPRIRYLGKRFIASALALNPVALLLTVPMLLTLMVVERQRARRAMDDAAQMLPVNGRQRTARA